MKQILIILGLVGIIGISIIILAILSLGGWIFGTATNTVTQAVNPTSIIYNYEWFKQQVEDIKAIENKIQVAENSVISFEKMAGERSTWTFEDKTEDSRLRAVAQGLRSQYEDVIADYNARSKMATRDIFQDGLIPNSMEAMASLIQ